MAQVSWRADDELVERVRQVASWSGRSLNEYLTVVLSAATDPELAGSEADAVRERLALAGLLEEAALGRSECPRLRPSLTRRRGRRRAQRSTN